jgi:isoamylase
MFSSLSDSEDRLRDCQSNVTTSVETDSKITHSRRIAVAVAFTYFLAFAVLNATASDHENLGATIDDAQSVVTFRVFSSRATRLEVWIYDTPFGFAEKLTAEMTVDPQNVWSKTIPLGDLAGKGVTGTIYYGYRAWGPNWKFDPSWTKWGQKGFVTDVDADGNRFNPNKLLLDPYAREVSHDPKTSSQTEDKIYRSGSDQRTTDTGDVAPKGIALRSDTGTMANIRPIRLTKFKMPLFLRSKGAIPSSTNPFWTG